MRRRIAAALVTASIILAGCSGDDDDGVIRIEPEDLTPDATVTVRTAAPGDEPTATPAASGEIAEVQGIVGAIDETAGSVVLTPLQGAAIDTIRVGPDTRITSAGGRSLTLADLRPSDRIVAKGAIEGGELIASEITVGQAVPGGDPGG